MRRAQRPQTVSFKSSVLFCFLYRADGGGEGHGSDEQQQQLLRLQQLVLQQRRQLKQQRLRKRATFCPDQSEHARRKRQLDDSPPGERRTHEHAQ